MQLRRTHMAIVGAGAAFVLAACGESTPEATGPSSDKPASGGPTTGSSQPSTQSAQPSTQSSSAGASSPPTSDAPERAADCTTGELEIALGEGGGAAGSYYAPLRFTNSSGEPCVVGGYPGVSYVAGKDAHQVGAPAERVDQQWRPVTLAPGEVAHATVRFMRVRNYEKPACRPTQVRAVRVYPPGETDSKLVRYSGTGCASTDIPGEQLTVEPVRPGPGGRQAG